MAAVALLGLVVTYAVLDGVRAPALEDALDVTRAALLTGAGVLCLVRWRMTGLARPALLGVALVALGVLAETLSALTPLLHRVVPAALSDRLALTATAVAAAVLLVLARRAPAIDAGAHPRRTLALVTALVAALVLISGALVLALVDPGPASTAAALALQSGAVAGLWLLLAVAEHRAGLDRRSPWLVPVLGWLSAGALLDALAGWDARPVAGAAAAAALVAGVVAVRGATHDVLASLASQSSRLLSLTLDAHDSEERQRSRQEHEQERLHEVRNVLAGLHGATATLRRYEDQLDPGVRRRLEDAVSGELRRLSHLVDPAAQVPVEDVDLAGCLAAVVTSEREQGAQLEVALSGARVRGRATDVATVVSALLVNARTHAPGSPVVLRAESRSGETRVLVEDRGPGVPLEARQRVFERGERAGTAAPGSGLGLYVAHRLVTDLGGALRVDARGGGGAAFVLTLPSGSPAAPGEDARQGLAQAGQVADRHGARV